MKKAMFITATLILALLLVGAVSANENSCKEELCVEFNNDPDDIICVEKRDSPSAVLHFDVFGPPANATNATLTLEDCTIVPWGQQGREKSDLSKCADQVNKQGYWHFVYTPAGILALSSAECVEGDGVPTILTADDIRVCPKEDILLRAFLTDGQGVGLVGKPITFTWVTNEDPLNPLTDSATVNTIAGGLAEYTIVGGLPKCQFSGPDECRYNVDALFPGDTEYKFSNVDFNILVRRFDTSLAVATITANQCQTKTLTATLTDENNNPLVNKTVYFFVNDEPVNSAITDNNGKAEIPYKINLEPSLTPYIIRAEFKESGCFRGSTGRGNLIVLKSGVELFLSDVFTCPDVGATITAKLTDLQGNPLANRTIKFQINPEYEAETNEDGIASVTIDPLPLGTYTITASFAGDDEYAAATRNATLKVDPEVVTELVLDPVSGKQGDLVDLRATLTAEGTPLEGKTVNFYINEQTIGSAVTNGDGVAIVPYTITQGPGDYDIKAVFEAVGCFLGSEDVAVLSVDLFETVLTVNDVTTCPQVGATLIARLTDVDGNPLADRTVNFEVDGISVDGVTDGDGIASVTIDPLALGTYTITASFAGDAEYAAVTNTGTLNVVPEVVTVLVLDPVSGKQGDLVDLRATLTAEGTPLEGKTVNFYINEQTIGSAVTNGDGVAIVPYTITQGPGDYDIKAVFEAVECFLGSEDVAVLSVDLFETVLTVNDVTTCPQVGATLIARLTDVDGNPLAGRTVNFEVAGISVDGVTDGDGIASVTIDPLALGTYTITASFAGDDEYAAVTNTGTLNVVPEVVTVLVLDSVSGKQGDLVDLRATLTAEGTPLEGKTVNFYINGDNIGSAITNAQGIAVLEYKITQNPGDYTIKAVFQGFECYLGSEAEATLKVEEKPPEPVPVPVDALIPMQPTGMPIAALILAVLAILGGLVIKKK